VFLLGVEDIVYWARELGGSKTPLHRLSAWRLAAVVLPGASGLLPRLHRVSEVVLDRLMLRLTHGQATMGGEAQRKAARA
jgi:polar amino acid transport system permease protein